MWTQVISALLGLWLMVAPAVLGHSGDLLSDIDRTAGPFVAAVSFLAATRICRGLRWLNVLPAVVMIAAPWFIDATLAATLNTVVAGAVVLALTPFGRLDQQRYGNGWLTLLPHRELPSWDAPRGNRAA